MSEEFLGCMVSLNCGDSLGTYQGHVSMVDKSMQTISLVQAYRNGIKCTVPELTISAVDIKDLKILKTAEDVEKERQEREKNKKNYIVRSTPKKAKSADLPDLKYSNLENGGKVQPDNNNTSLQNGSDVFPKKLANNAFQMSSSGQRGEKSQGYGNQKSTPSKGKRSEVIRRADTAPSNLSSSLPEGTLGSTGNGVLQHKKANGDLPQSTPKKPDSPSPPNSNGITFNLRKQDSGEVKGHQKKPANATTDDYLGTGKSTAFGRRRNNSVSSMDVRKKPPSSAPRVIDGSKNSQKMRARDAACFSAPIDDTYMTEFDFEKNLALFDKAAIFEEINKTQSKDDLTLEMINKKKKNYRHDENVLSQSLMIEDIVVPHSIGQKTYNSTNGVRVPTISNELREKIFQSSEKCGLSAAKRIELVGLAGCHVAIANLGGTSRLNPHNVQQRPTIVVLCGPHFYGAQGVSCARHLANQDVDVTVFLPSFVKMAECLTTEVEIYKQTDGVLTQCVKDLLNSPVDLIINALDCRENSFLHDQQWYHDVIRWANKNKAPVLSLDPPCEQEIETRHYKVSADYADQLLRIFEFSLKCDLVGKASLCNQLTLHGHVVKEILSGFVNPNHGSPDVILGFLPHAFTLIRMKLPHISVLAASFVYTLNAYPELLIPYSDDILQCYLKYHQFNLAACLSVLFTHCEDKIIAHLNDISSHVEDLPAMEKYSVFRLFQAVAEKYPQEVLPYLRVLTADFSDAVVSSAALPCLCVLSDHYPERFVGMVDKLSMLVERQPYHVGYVDKIFTDVAMQNEIEARKILTNCLVQFKEVDEAYYPVIFTCIREISVKYKKLTENYKSAITALGSSGGQEYVQSLMDYLDGNSKEPDFFKAKRQSQLSRKSEESGVLESRTKHQSGGKSSSETQKMPTAKSTAKIDDENKVENGNSQSQQTQTTSSAPQWCRNLASVLNKPSLDDWRFLAVYLGFSCEDIQSFSVKTNPTLYMLGHWCQRHSERDAYHAVYIALQQIGRNDCLQILENAVQVDDQVIPQKFSGSTEKISPLCISYHYSNILEVKLLHHHLELAGLDCWMDKGQYVSGEQLCKKMKEAMKGSKLVLIMCTNMYMTSPTCFKQVQLAQELNKPIVPVIIGPLSWPPSGPMSVVFSQLPCVQLYEFSAQNKRGRIYWPLFHFLELLARISYYVPPGAKKITKEEYKNWIPTLEKIPERLHDTLLKYSINPKTESIQRASVFISYQWEKVSEALVLHALLTQLGYSCWLDVLHLGSLPLEGEADKNIRSAKAIICCVTPKFTTMPSCSREVTLASLLNVPIIPLVMEKMFWPPRGSVALPFSKCSYIDFTCEENETPFTPERLQELCDCLSNFSVPRKDVNISELLFTETSYFELPVDISSDFESTDELEENSSDNTDQIYLCAHKSEIGAAGTDEYHQRKQDRLLGDQVKIDKSISTNTVNGETATVSDDGNQEKTSCSQQVSNAENDNVKVQRELTNGDKIKNANLVPQVVHWNGKSMTEDSLHEGIGMSDESNKSAQHNIANGLHEEQVINSTILVNGDDNLPSKMDDDIKRSNVCAIL
ncbi:uncharacterized protein [Ptychodera flava]|uniref:uncharacterized protein n=1 Tax=Ptychodera flava TaxID=63121 RepID=UPI00396A5EBF